MWDSNPGPQFVRPLMPKFIDGKMVLGMLVTCLSLFSQSWQTVSIRPRFSL